MAVVAFSMVLLGIRVFSGIKELNKEVMIYVVKLGLVAWFAFNLGGFGSAPFDIVHSLTTIVFGGYSPWGQMDKFFCEFFGTGCRPNMKLSNSFIAHAGVLIASGTMGLLVFVVGTLAMLTTIYFMLRAIYTYLAAIMLICFVLIMSPLFVPLALFARTTRYLYKWLDYLIAAMLHPIILFGFLYMFLGTFSFMLDWFTNGIMGGNDLSPYWRSTDSMFNWMLTADPQTVKDLGQALGQETSRSAVQSFVSPSMSAAINMNPLTTYAVDFGANQVMALQGVVFGFLGLFIVSYLMFSMINYLPSISEAIANVVLGLSVEGIPFVSEMRYMYTKAKGAISGI